MDTKISKHTDTKYPDPPTSSLSKATGRSEKTKRRELVPISNPILPLADPLKLDNTTGFLQASRISALSSLKKERFLQLYRIHPNASACARAIGITPRTIRCHLQRDEAFKDAFDEVREELADEIEGKVFEFAQRPQNFLDRIAFLKAFRPERWNPSKNILIHPQPDPKVLNDLLEKLKTYDDLDPKRV